MDGLKCPDNNRFKKKKKDANTKAKRHLNGSIDRKGCFELKIKSTFKNDDRLILGSRLANQAREKSGFFFGQRVQNLTPVPFRLRDGSWTGV